LQRFAPASPFPAATSCAAGALWGRLPTCRFPESPTPSTPPPRSPRKLQPASRGGGNRQVRDLTHNSAAVGGPRSAGEPGAKLRLTRKPCHCSWTAWICRPGLERLLEHGEVGLDNHRLENAIRPWRRGPEELAVPQLRSSGSAQCGGADAGGQLPKAWVGSRRLLQRHVGAPPVNDQPGRPDGTDAAPLTAGPRKSLAGPHPV
jgi:hypothetical protein